MSFPEVVAAVAATVALLGGQAGYRQRATAVHEDRPRETKADVCGEIYEGQTGSTASLGATGTHRGKAAAAAK